MRAESALAGHALLARAPMAAEARASSKHLNAQIVCAGQLGDLHGAWDDLLSRAATANVFMHPGLAAAAYAAEPEVPHRMLLVWQGAGEGRKLAGVWSFSVGRPRRSMSPTNVLRTSAFTHGFLATPVIDREHLDEVLHVMLDAIVGDPSLPKIVALDTIATGEPVYDALTRVLAQRGTAPRVFRTTQRPLLRPGLDGSAYLERALSSATRKKLRQRRRKLGEMGAVRLCIAREPRDLRNALEQFLVLEASGWKGREGTALLCDQADASFMRGAIGALAEHGCAEIHAIYCDNKPISMQIVARAGDAAFTWKTAYDEGFSGYSPGMLLLEDYTAAFLADPTLALVDSCSFDDSGFMAAWCDRRPVADAWIDARRGGSLEFHVVARLQMSYRNMREAAKAAYHRWSAPGPKV